MFVILQPHFPISFKNIILSPAAVWKAQAKQGEIDYLSRENSETHTT